MTGDHLDFPAVIRSDGQTIAEWVTEHGSVDDTLVTHGAVLFRGFAMTSLEDFDNAVAVLVNKPGTFLEESSPRTRLSGNAFTSTDYPSRYAIAFHSEYSYSDTWPGRLVFGCLVPPGSGGATLISDTRRVLQRLPEEQRRAFIRHGIRYRRNYMAHVGVSWQVAFGTDDQAEAERICSERGIEWRWSDAGLHTTQYGAAVIRHPLSDELCWFNHGLIFNVHGLEPAGLREALLNVDEDARPNDTSLGDGTSLDEDAIECIRDGYAQESVAVDWQAGDVLIIDNMITAHARAPYTGDRRIVVSMGDPVHRVALKPVE
jgi:Taurine catabolism dioxygenase TauD, TfdA family